MVSIPAEGYLAEVCQENCVLPVEKPEKLNGARTALAAVTH